MSNHDIPPDRNAHGEPDQAASAQHRGTVTAESETRGGPEAPQDSLDNDAMAGPGRFPGIDPDPELGYRAALPAGTLPGPYLNTQGDENREPPDNAPGPVNATVTVNTVGRGTPEEA